MQMMSAQVETSRQLVIDGDGKFIYDGTMAQILLVSYKPKAIIISGEDNPEVLEKLGGGVLGHKWLPTEDELEFCSTINISPRTSSGKTGPNLTLDDLPKMMIFTFTRRLCLAILASFYYPSGLLSCHLIRCSQGPKSIQA